MTASSDVETIQLLSEFNSLFSTTPSRPKEGLVRDLEAIKAQFYFGYGQLIDCAARLWAKEDPENARVSGPCAGTIDRWRDEAAPFLDGTRADKVQSTLLLVDAFDCLRDPGERDGIEDPLEPHLSEYERMTDVSWEELMVAGSVLWAESLQSMGLPSGGQFVVGPTRAQVTAWREKVEALKGDKDFELGDEATRAFCKGFEVGQHIRLRFNHDDFGETGWAKYLGELKAEIANVPMAVGISLGDVVSLKVGQDGWLTWGEVLESKYGDKLAIRYAPPTQESYSALREHLDPLGYGVEGMLPGTAIINCPKGVSVARAEADFLMLDGVDITPFDE